MNILRPGGGMNVDPRTLDAGSLAEYADPRKLQSVTDFLLNVIPTTVVDAFAKGEILQVLLFAVLFGFALQRLGPRGAPVLGFIDGLSQALFGIVGIVMRLAPLGAFGAMAFTIGKYGFDSLLSLGYLMGCFYLTCLVFVFGALGLVARAARLQHLEVPQLHPRRTVHRARHLILGVGAAAHDRQAAEARRQQTGGGAGDSRRLLVQSRRHFDLSDHGDAVHRAGHQHADGPACSSSRCWRCCC